MLKDELLNAELIVMIQSDDDLEDEELKLSLYISGEISVSDESQES